MKNFLIVFCLILGITPALAAEGYRIKSGDTLRVEVLEDPNLNRSALVLPDGSVTLPMAGTVAVAGMTVDAVQAAIVALLAPNFAASPNVYVSVERLHDKGAGGTGGGGFTVYVLGEAEKPGKYSVTPGTSIMQFLAEFGGFTDYAATRRIQLRRTDAAGNETVYLINFRAIEDGQVGVLSGNMAPGDVIVIPQRHLFE